MSSYVVSRSRIIACPPAAAFEQVSDFHNWTSWSPWENFDTDLQRTYTGSDSGPGAKYAWSGKKSGAGSMEILKAKPDQEIQIDLRFTKPWTAKNPTTFSFRPVADGTEVTWTMTGELRGVSGLLARLFRMDKRIGGDFDRGLADMAALLEPKPTP